MKLFNTRTNREIIFDNRAYVLNEADLGISEACHSSFKGINQVGEYLVNSTLEARDVALTGYVLADTPEQMRTRKRELYRLLNPLDSFQLIRDGFKLECVARGTVRFGDRRAQNSDSAAKFILEAWCPDPCFTPVSGSRVSIATWTGSFGFPLSIPPEGIVMGMRTPSTMISIRNDGDLPAGILLEFQARGRVVNPSLLNVETREYMRLDHTMEAGEMVRIDTNYGRKAVVSLLGGAEISIMGRWDLRGTFLQLAVGDNTFRYDADENISNLEVTMAFYPRYLGV